MNHISLDNLINPDDFFGWQKSLHLCGVLFFAVSVCTMGQKIILPKDKPCKSDWGVHDICLMRCYCQLADFLWKPKLQNKLDPIIHACTLWRESPDLKLEVLFTLPKFWKYSNCVVCGGGLSISSLISINHQQIVHWDQLST